MSGRRLLKFGAALGAGGLAFYTYKHDTRPWGHIVYGAEAFTPHQFSVPVPPEPYTKWDYNWDKRDCGDHSTDSSDIRGEKDSLGSKKKMKHPARHLILIRHGQYNLEGATDADRVLTKLGREQADMVGKRLATLDRPYSSIICSTMTRAMETAQIISKHLPGVKITTNELLEEGAPIPPEPPIGRWRPEHAFHQDGARIEAAFRKYFHRASSDQEQESYEVIVCHANVIRYFVCRALQVPPEAWLRLSLKHCSLTWVSISGSGRVTLRSFSDAGFMDPCSLTTS